MEIYLHKGMWRAEVAGITLVQACDVEVRGHGSLVKPILGVFALPGGGSVLAQDLSILEQRILRMGGVTT